MPGIYCRMAHFDHILCPLCVFTSKYVDLTIGEEGQYLCAICGARFTYEELMQFFMLSHYQVSQKRTLEPLA